LIFETNGTVKKFEQWVLENYRPKGMTTPPHSWNRKKELYYKIGQNHYGPILIEDIPSEFRIR
jgi:hypothetical protein